MTPTFGLAIYFIMWWLTLFAVLPFGLRTQQDQGDVVPGTPESAPAKPRLARIFLINTAVSGVLFACFWVALMQGWLDPETFPLALPVDVPKA